jgi:hypothetical protein
LWSRPAWDTDTGDAITATYDAGVLTVRVAGALKDPAGNQAQRIELTR